MTAYDRLVDKLRDHGSRVRDIGARAESQCPAHEDRQASLSVRGIEGQALVYCHAGCDTRDVLATLDLTLADLFDEPRGATYRYDDGRIVRRTPDKRFYQHGNTSGPAQLYHLSRLQASTGGGVFLVEGEKDVHAIESAGGIATTAPMGAKNFTRVDVTPLQDRAVTVVVVRDGAGAQWADDVRTALHQVAGRLRFVQAATGKDAADHIAATGEGRELAGWLDYQWPDDEQLQDDEPSHLDKLKAALVDSAGLDDIPDPEPIIGDDILFRDTLAWMVGKPGCGKSFTALDMAGCVATGEAWQTYRVEQGRVLYLVAEGVRGVKQRVRAWEQSMNRTMTGVDFLPIAVQSTNGAMWDAFVELARERQYALIVIDTQSRITVGVEENSNTEMGEFVHQAERLRTASSACVLIVHHIGRNGDTGRGATVLDGALSTIIKVTKDEDRIRMECTKNKDAAEWDDINLRTVPTGESVVLMLDDGFSPKAQTVSHAALKMGLSWWEHHADNWVTASNLVDVVAPKTTFYRNVRELEREQIVELDTNGRWPRYRIPKPPENGSVGHGLAVVPQSHP